MNGSTIRGSLSGESRHIPRNPKILGCLKLFIRMHSSKKLFMSDLECISGCVIDRIIEYIYFAIDLLNRCNTIYVYYNITQRGAVW